MAVYLDIVTYEEITGYYCEDLEKILEEPGGTLYYCEDHDEYYNREASLDGESSKCPSGAGHKGKKVADLSCSECEPSHEVEVVVGWRCECDEIVSPEQWESHVQDGHVIVKAVRRAAIRDRNVRGKPMPG